jgi:DNA-directed RNA polymerase specialized sigma24 family protein
MSETPRLFPTTSRTLIESLKAPDPKTREMSLARFCTLYYPAIYGYARSLGLSLPDAQDRAQDFFVEVVRDGLLTQYDTGRGTRLSSWLMSCFKNLEWNHRKASSAIKRGGGREFVEFDPDHAEHSYRAAHLAHLEAGPTFDLMLAREIWLAAKALLLRKHETGNHRELVADLLPIVLMERWPGRPMPTQEELAKRHETSALRLKAFYNRTLKAQARRTFQSEAQAASPGIPDTEVDHLWHLLCRYGEA